MANYTYAQLEGLWVQYGGSKATAPMAAAIAMAESGGNPNAYNGSDPSGGSRGLWQINGAHGSQSSFDVATNTRAAVAISNDGKNWQPWGTYTSGAYRKYLNPNATPAQTAGYNPIDPGGLIPGDQNLVSALSGTAANAVITPLLQYAVMALLIGGGMVMMTVGMYLLIRDSNAYKNVEKQVTSVAKDAAVAA